MFCTIKLLQNFRSIIWKIEDRLITFAPRLLVNLSAFVCLHPFFLFGCFMQRLSLFKEVLSTVINKKVNNRHKHSYRLFLLLNKFITY